MKFVQITVHFEYSDLIEQVLDRHGVETYVRYPLMEGRDLDGKHFGTQVHPGNVTVYHVQIEDESVDRLLVDLKRFRDEKAGHRHIEATVLPIERRLSDE